MIIYYCKIYNLLPETIITKLLLTLNNLVNIIVSQFSQFSCVLFLFPSFSLRPDKLALDWSRPFSIKSPVFSSVFSSVFQLDFSTVLARYQLDFSSVSTRFQLEYLVSNHKFLKIVRQNAEG